MITNYTPEKCRYLVEKLAKTVYLISEDAVKDIRIDNGDAYINSVSESPIKIDCYSINLQEEDSLDERYKFTHTLTFSVNGYANSDDFQGRYYAIVKDNEGTYWLVNPLFPCKVTYTYTLGYQQNHTDFTIGTVSNHPVLRLHNFGDATPYECQEYFLDGIDELWLNEKRYTVHDGNSVKYTNDGFKTIEYNKRTATFTETFDGTNTSHQIDFDILFSQYKSSWHYNLLEFKDNLYSAVFGTRNNKYALCGFSFGLQPSFKINADDTIQSADRIQIILQDAHDVGDAIEFFDSIDYEYLSARTYEYTSEYDGYECIGEGVARYLLQKEVDALGNETGNYKALEGYTGRFPGLNIVGTFSNTETFTSVECNGSDCTIDTSFPSTLTFNNKECQTYYLKADSSWSMSSSANYITVSPSSGDAGVGYYVSVCNTLTPGAEVQTSTLSIQYCSTSTTVDVNVVQYSGCFPQGAIYTISANEQVFDIPVSCCVRSAKETSNVGVDIIVYDSYIRVVVPENNTGRYRSITLLVVFCDGTSASITINQSNVYEKWENYGDPFCDGADLYQEQYLWTGLTKYTYVITTTHRDILVESHSSECGQIRYKWVKTNETICVYTGDDMYRWVSSGWTCVGQDKYANNVKQVSHNGGLTWENVVPEETSATTLIETDSEDCGYTPPLVGQYLTVVPLTSGTIAKVGHSGGFQYSTDSGSTWNNATSATSISLTTGNKVMFKGTITPTAYQASGQFSASTGTQFDVEGNVMSLLYGDEYSGKTSLSGKDYAFRSLFQGCGGLVSAALLSLPATTLSNTCYASMFKNCTSLTAPPPLSATSLQTGCYKEMFAGCTSLTRSPKLPATTLANQSYNGMFNGCTSLNNITCMATNRSAMQCTTNWVNNVASTGTFYKNSSTTWSRGVDAVPTGWEIKDAD